jgi:glycine betaine/proline transport system ATP-binding protein
LKDIKGQIQFQNVSFAYEEDKDVVRNISFEALPGSVTAFVGTSGSGKSTISGLVSSFLNPDDGEILVDGHDLQKVTLESYRSKLGVVLQEDFLFEGTIRENILFPRPNATEEELLNAVKSAYVNQFTDKFEMGLDTQIGERGVKLSGGQQQRVGIARSLAVEPEIWFLDEPFSALDPLIRREMQDEFLRLQSVLHKTILFVTHDFDEALRLADRIAIMKDGVIEQIDTPANIVLKPATEYVAKFTRGVPRERVLSCKRIMEEYDATATMSDVTVSANAIIETVAGSVLTEQNPVAVIDAEGNIVGALNRNIMIDVLFGETNSMPVNN